MSIAPPRLKKPAARPRKPYGEVLAEWMKLHESDDKPLPESVSDQYTPQEKDEYYEEICDRLNGGGHEDPHLNDVSPETRTQLLENAVAPNGGTGKGIPYEVFDVQALDWRPDEHLTTLDGTQELLDPFDGLPDDRFDQLSSASIEESCVFVKRLDPQFSVARWLPPTLESALAAINVIRSGRSLETFINLLNGHVSRYVDETRTTEKRSCLAFFVRNDVYLLLLLDRVGSNGTTFAPKAHFYAWSIRRAAQLLKK